MHNVILSARVTLLFTDGCAKAEGNALTVTGATTAALLISLATNYRLSPELFFTECPKLEERDPMPLVKEILDKAKAYSIEELYERHLKDYRSLFDTADIFLSDGKEDHRPTNERLKAYEEGQSDTGLEELYFRYGRYLLICSSRKGCLPPNLQGIWAGTDGTPWGSGYWHNINIQMNYWPAFRTGLASLFVSYADYFKAFLPKAREYAYAYVRSIHPRAAEKDKCGYLLSTGAYAYSIEPFTPTGHSGPGTMGLTTKLFWEYYDYTQDETLLRETVYPVLLDTVRLYTKSVVLTDGLYLASHSASPEQTDFMTYPAGKPWNPYYHLTVGCAFDSQMIYESGKDFLKAEAVLGLHSAEGETVKAQLPFYDPVVIGASGQIKEFREETFYGEYGEYRHRHISQLVGLVPGSSVNKATPATGFVPGRKPETATVPTPF
ncbi:MAG: hypothetical protein MJ078_05350 [Clostridia bacterium]|nr:hypothetical protein [Clostridia bacterium]